MTFAFQLQKPGRVTRPGKKFNKKRNPFFVVQFWSWVRFCMTRQKTQIYLLFWGRVYVTPSDIAGEPFCIQEFCFVTYQLIWSYSQKPLTFSSYMASSTCTRCCSTLYTICLILIELRMFYVIYFCL